MLAGKSIMPCMKHIQMEMKTWVLGSPKNILSKSLQGLLLNRENGSLQWWWCSVDCVRSIWGRNNIFFYKGICYFLLNPLKYSRLGSLSPEVLCLGAKRRILSPFLWIFRSWAGASQLKFGQVDKKYLQAWKAWRIKLNLSSNSGLKNRPHNPSKPACEQMIKKC